MFHFYALDHIVLNVADVEQSLAFYTQVLHLLPERVDAFHRGDAPFPSVRINNDTVIDLFPADHLQQRHAETMRNLHHFTLVLKAEEFHRFQEHLISHGITILEGPVPRWGARGEGLSIYFDDPDGNHIEVRCYETLLHDHT